MGWNCEEDFGQPSRAPVTRIDGAGSPERGAQDKKGQPVEPRIYRRSFVDTNVARACRLTGKGPSDEECQRSEPGQGPIRL